DPPPCGFRIRTTNGSPITDYVRRAYASILTDGDRLGGANVLTTTLLQMNDRLDEVNYATERDRPSLSLNLLNAASMNLSPIDGPDPVALPNLISAGKVVVRDLVLGS